ncbi:MAG: acetyl-CoA carboxylase carboxyltransferase subunit alpha [bacterium]|nr:acetyl-CoA carboxylase carboxyltransferase subunit alpha [bacterium]
MEELWDLYEIEKFLDELDKKILTLRELKQKGQLVNPQELEILELKAQKIKEELFNNLHPYHRVQLSRHPKRPVFEDLINNVFEDFYELFGDRMGYNDFSIVGGLAKLNEYPVFILGHSKGKNTQDRIKRNYGMPNPEGFYKAIRVMEVANNFRTPLITVVDTPGAYPGDVAEQRGQFIAIARAISKLFDLDIPVISLILSEGGSGGALALNVANFVVMLENAWYSVISPEGAASILYRDSSKAPLAAKQLKITSYDLLSLNIIDEIIKEPLQGAHKDLNYTFDNIKHTLIYYLKKALKLDNPKEHRFEKYRNIGIFDNLIKI